MMRRVVVKLIRRLRPSRASAAHVRAKVRRSIREDALRMHWRNCVELSWKGFNRWGIYER